MPATSSTEAAGAGTDTVQSSLNHTLGRERRKARPHRHRQPHGTGNGLANILTGNSGANTLDGGAGGDIMIGGLGNDSYFVDNGLDQVIEAAGGGTDTVNASLSHDLEDEVENLILTGTAAINGTGNSLANTLTGNSAANRLDGGLGADIAQGRPRRRHLYRRQCRRHRLRARRPGHRQGAELGQLHARRGDVENLTLTGPARSTAPATCSPTS